MQIQGQVALLGRASLEILYNAVDSRQGQFYVKCFCKHAISAYFLKTSCQRIETSSFSAFIMEVEGTAQTEEEEEKEKEEDRGEWECGESNTRSRTKARRLW